MRTALWLSGSWTNSRFAGLEAHEPSSAGRSTLSRLPPEKAVLGITDLPQWAAGREGPRVLWELVRETICALHVWESGPGGLRGPVRERE